MKKQKQHPYLTQLAEEYLTYMLIFILYRSIDYCDYNTEVINDAVEKFNENCVSPDFMFESKVVLYTLIPALDDSPSFVPISLT